MSPKVGRQYVNESGVVVDVLSFDGETVVYAKPGGGLRGRISSFNFAQMFSLYSPDEILPCHYYSVYGLEGRFCGYPSPDVRCGRNRPLFTLLVAEKVMVAFNKLNPSDSKALRVVRIGDGFRVSQGESAPSLMFVTPKSFQTEDGDLNLFDLSLGWAWEDIGAKRQVDWAERPYTPVVTAGVLTLPSGDSIDLLSIQALLSFYYEQYGNGDLAEAAEKLRLITRHDVNSYGEKIPTEPF